MPFPPVVPLQARQTMKDAFEELERTITSRDANGFRSSTLESVRQEALDIEKMLGSRGRLRNMRRLMPLFTALEHYSQVWGTLCNGTPYLPWIWAPISLILRVASEHIESFDTIISAYGRIGESLPRFDVLRTTLARNAKFQETLASFYADILEFHKHAYKFVRRSGQCTSAKNHMPRYLLVPV